MATISLGACFLIMLLLATTSLPFWAHYRLSHSQAFVPENTQTILVMGAGGFPSEDVLMRLWFATEAAHDFPDSKIVVATPGNFIDSTSTVFLMYQFFVDHQIDSSRIIIENRGLNTRHQAIMTFEMFEKGLFREPLVIVSSPEHIYRSVKSFRKAGFKQVSGLPATERLLETDLGIDAKDLGGNKFIPGTANSISLRYKFWNYLHLEISLMREYVAIGYYRMKGWI